MKITDARFTLTDARGEFVVKFIYPGRGFDPVCSVEHQGKTARIANPHRRYKPCLTHCLDLIAQAMYEPPPTQFAKNRKEATRKDTAALAAFGRPTRRAAPAKRPNLKMVGGPEQ